MTNLPNDKCGLKQSDSISSERETERSASRREGWKRLYSILGAIVLPAGERGLSRSLSSNDGQA